MSTPAVSSQAMPERSLRVRQFVTVLLLFGGYGALYFCRADLAVGTPLLVTELARQGMPHDVALVRIGAIVSSGVLAYALGKLFLGGLGDFWGGRRNFLIGLGGATCFTALFAASGTLPLFTLAWIGNRLTQSVAWAGLIKISSRWFDHTSYGTIAGVLSVSYLVGDAAARQGMGMLLAHGFGWRALFYFAAAVAGVLWLANGLYLRESRAEAGFREPQVNPRNVFSASESRPASIRALVLPLLRSRAFLLVCLLSFGCTVVRETFNSWTPVYLHESLGFSESRAASLSAIFPGVGALSVLLSGWLSDRLGAHGRSLILFVGLAGTAAALLALMSLAPGTAAWIPLFAIGVIAFCLLGPYSYLGGAFALDFGGRQGAAVSSGLIDGVGYIGGTLAGVVVAKISVAFSWKGVFVGLAGVSALSALAAGYLLALGLATHRVARTT